MATLFMGLLGNDRDGPLTPSKAKIGPHQGKPAHLIHGLIVPGGLPPKVTYYTQNPQWV